ncbi:Zinc finger protein 185 LIM domain protein [Triplophysa tibetana]|uniref:Zinc finger protein 185 LIM domain protein n=1 Tax=Triplophysa tibetana TaxID=1572043 RepID=A0A5A9NLQ3_9TELE|nr:Zinc finger protein 185 LIM domain protein [Triplophysa tibetana]
MASPPLSPTQSHSKGNRQSVLKTTKVRTALKGDNSWIQRRQQENLEQEEDEKPWIAEVRANRSDGVLEETSPVSTATTKDPLPTVSTENGVNSFTKKSSDSYKKIAPHTIRVNNETPVQSAPALDEEEMEKRTAAASSVLKGSAASQRSYVLSAAKKYDSSEQPNSSTQTSTSFVAKRVVISDDEDLPTTEPAPSASQHSVESLTALSDTLISFKTEPARMDPKLILEKRNGLKNDDLLDLSESKPALDLLSQDLLTGGSSLPYTQQTQKSLDLLTDDVIPSNTSATRINTDYTYSTTTVKQSTHFESCDDPFDPIPIGSHRTKSHEWYSDPISDSTSSSTVTIKHYESPMNVDPNMSEDALVSLAEDVIPFNTNSSTSTKIVDTVDEEKLPESESKKGFVYVKEYVNNSNHDGSSSDYVTSSTSGYNYSSPSTYSSSKEKSCTFCGELVGNDTITIEHLNISCHPSCFKCGICSKPMGDLLYNMFLHRGTVHCESCYSNVL